MRPCPSCGYPKVLHDKDRRSGARVCLLVKMEQEDLPEEDQREYPVYRADAQQYAMRRAAYDEERQTALEDRS